MKSIDRSQAGRPLNILFVTHVMSQTRHFVTVFEQLRARGHQLTVLVEHNSSKPLIAAAFLNHIAGIKYEKLIYPKGFWGQYAKGFRSARNYLLYYHPRFERSSIFRSRAYGWVDPYLRATLSETTPPKRDFVEFLEGVEDAIPPDKDIASFIGAGKFHLVLISPLIFHQNLFQHDYVKAAHALGVPVGFPVFSWDNLTTKGNVQVLPDRIWVWNDIQRSELDELHGVDPARVGVMGAWRFDEFRAFTPSKRWAEYCMGYGFDPSKRLITYLGSSPAIAPHEGEFVKRWIERVRASDDPAVRDANILVRAHPRNVEAWKGDNELEAIERFHFEEPAASNFWDTQNLYNALHFCNAAVGLNTSAMLEAAILLRPVHTVVDDSVRQGHEGTVHFEYLTKAGGGLLYQAADFDEHIDLLALSLREPLEKPDPRSQSFQRAFLDDGALPGSPTDRLVAEIEALAELKKLPARQSLADRARGLRIKAAIRMGALKVEKDPDYVNSAERRVLRLSTWVAPQVSRFLGAIDRTRSLESHLVTYAAKALGHRRRGPDSLSGMPTHVRLAGRIGRSGIRAALGVANVVGLRGRVASSIGPYLVEFGPGLPVRAVVDGPLANSVQIPAPPETPRNDN